MTFRVARGIEEVNRTVRSSKMGAGPVGQRILVVDDDPDIRMCVEAGLAGEGFAVVTASNGAAALQALDTGDAPDLILLDRLMPEVGGQEFLWRLRARANGRDVPVVLMSSYHDAPPASAHGGPVEFLKKPFSLAQLLGAVSRHARRSER
jgi:CheY-like chemotaxis protein